MDFRRSFGLRAPCPIGDSTIMVPQMENYTLFATPFLTLNKKIDKLIEKAQQDIESKSGEKTQRITRSRDKEKKGSQKPSEEASQEGDGFGIVLNVATVEPEQLTIAFEKGNVIKVEVKQDKVESKFGSVTFSRNCSYRYELPDEIDKKTLVALWTSDDYLIILPVENLRKELLDKSIRVSEESEDPGLPEETTESSEPKPAGKKPKKPSKWDDKKTTKQKAAEYVKGIFEEKCKIPVHRVTRMLRPRLDIFMLRKYMADFESYVSTCRKFIENSSFVTQNSKTAERCIRFLAKSSADEFFEDEYIGGNKSRKKKDLAADSGYSTANTPTSTSTSEMESIVETS